MADTDVSISYHGTAVTVTVAEADVARLRRMVDESGTATYTDALLGAYVAEHVGLDYQGLEPNASTWVDTYDLNAAAADIWHEKAAAHSNKYDRDADGASLSRNQLHENAVKQAKYFGARAKPTVLKWRPEPLILMGELKDTFSNVTGDK